VTVTRIVRTTFGWTIGVLATVVCTLVALAIPPVPGARLLQQKLARTWGRICVWGSGCPVRVEGRDRIDPDGRFVVMSNHQSALDIPLLMGALPATWRTVFWAKQSLFRVPVLGWAMRMLGHMPIDRVDRRSAGRMLSSTVERTAEARSVLVFPEETYSPDGELLPFQRGGFVLALKTGMPILPVGLSGTRDALPPRRHLIHHATLTVRFGSPIETAGLGVSSRQELMDRTRAAIGSLLDPQTSAGNP
jgi:1-acyl-sn-glycerol-3-phosphate acyltransferase